MTDEQVAQQPPSPAGQHDTRVLTWPASGAGAPGEQGTAYGEQPYGQPPHPAYGTENARLPLPPVGAPGYGFGPEGAAGGWEPEGNPEAAYWEQRYRRQRTWTRFLGASIAAALLLFVGGGLLIWNALASRDASTVTQGNDALVKPGDPQGDPGGTGPDQSSPDGSEPGSETESDQPDLSDVPLPEALRGPSSMLGIDNVEELLNTAVSMGLMTQEQADAIRGAVGSGESLEGLLGNGGLGGQG